MRDDAPSRTALWVAAARGMGMLLPDGVRIADDPYGTLFASPALTRLVDRNLGSGRGRAFAGMPGVRTWIAYMQVRTRLLDDAVRELVARGGRQVVVLGAGYDCRALRMPELAGAQVYEIDHPATQSHKRSVLDANSVASPAHYVSWDFETRALDELPDALADAGHDPAAPTLTIWEGVTMYLTEGAIDASLRAIAAWSGPGSSLALTYYAKSHLAEPSFATRVVQAVASRLGEPWKWGWNPDELPGYLHDRGFALTRDIATPDAARELLPPELAATIRRTESRVAIASRLA